MAFFGIDFGTTNSAVFECAATGQSMKMTPHGEDSRPIPSLVAIHPDKGMLFGNEVKRRRSSLSAEGYRVFSSFKTILGTDQQYSIGEEVYTPERVTAQFLRYLKDSIMKTDGVDITQAVYSIPVGFSPKQRRALRNASRMAGIEIQAFVSESTAACISCADELKGASVVAVMDWGGGTLDVSIVAKDRNGYSELAVDGKRLGGNDIDSLVARYIHKKVMQSEAVPCSFEDMPPAARDSIDERSELAKITLSTDDAVNIRLTRYTSAPVVRESLTIVEFNELISQQVQSAADFLQQTVEKAGLSLAQIDAILMAGGSCEMRSICEKMKQLAQEKHTHICYPERFQWVAASGAAMLGARESTYRLQHAFGVLLSDNSFYPIFSKGTEIPGQPVQLRFGVVEDTTSATFVFADDRKNVIRRLSLPIKGFTAEKLTLSADIDDDLIVHVTLESDFLTKMTVKDEFTQLSFSFDLR